MNYEDVRAIALTFAGVADHITHGTPSLKVGGKFVLREREPGVLALRRPTIDERDMLLEADPRLFFITDHYRDYPYVLIRLDGLDPDRFKGLFGTIWRELALKRHVEAQESKF